MAYRIIPVQSGKHKKEFLDVARIIYQDDPHWVCPLDKQLNRIFDPATNIYFEHGFAERWLLKDDDHRLLGRIAAFGDERHLKMGGIKVGGIGFFECINDQQAADLLFDTALSWLKSRQMDAVDGPVNFGENDRFWGLLVEGFTEPPFTTNYHLPYYKQLFENYGFQVYYEMQGNLVYLDRPLDVRFDKILQWLKQKDNIEFRTPEKHELERYTAYFREIYNDAWQFHETFKPLDQARALKLAREIRFLFIRGMVTFAFVRNEPAGFLICTPDLNQIIRNFNGKLNPIRLLLLLWRKRNDFLWYREKGILTRVSVVAIGVKPKFQQYGIETGLFMSSKEAVLKMGFKTAELRWAGDFNPKIERLHQSVGAVPVRKHITYRYLFNPGVEFKRYRPIPMNRQ